MKHPNIIRPIKLTTTFPEDIRAKLDIHLFSPSEGRVPQGAIQRFLLERIREYFAQKRKYLTKNESEIVALILQSHISEAPQEWWSKYWANAEEAYSTATKLLKELS